MKKKLEMFKETFLSAENTTGFGMIGADYDVININGKTNALDTKLLETITRQLYNYFGVSHEIINGTASELQYEQFVDNTIKPIAKQIEEEFTYKLFSNPEINHLNRIKAELIDLEISTLGAKTAFFKEMIFGGVINRNEVRVRIGLPRGPADLDEFMESKNFQALNPGNYIVEGGGENGNQSDEGA
jgi:phage portal protein BeeE